MNITQLIILALLIEALVQAVKPVWDTEAKKLSVPELISMVVGAIVAVIGQINMFEGLISTSSIFMLYVCCVLTGAALGRGPSFIHDLWQKVRTFNKDSAIEASGAVKSLSDIVNNILDMIRTNKTPVQEDDDSPVTKI